MINVVKLVSFVVLALAFKLVQEIIVLNHITVHLAQVFIIMLFFIQITQIGGQTLLQDVLKVQVSTDRIQKTLCFNAQSTKIIDFFFKISMLGVPLQALVPEVCRLLKEENYKENK